MKLFFFFALP